MVILFLQLGNDMTSRIKTRLNNNIQQQEVLTMINYLLPGSVFLYNGDEINMADVSLMDNWNMATKNKPGRTLMPWDSSWYAGFSNSSSCPLPYIEQNNTINVEVNIDFIRICVCERVCVCVCVWWVSIQGD